jgi:hypothetical protein
MMPTRHSNITRYTLKLLSPQSYTVMPCLELSCFAVSSAVLSSLHLSYPALASIILSSSLYLNAIQSLVSSTTLDLPSPDRTDPHVSFYSLCLTSSILTALPLLSSLLLIHRPPSSPLLILLTYCSPSSLFTSFNPPPSLFTSFNSPHLLLSFFPLHFF